MTKKKLIDEIRNNEMFQIRSSDSYEPWNVDPSTIREMENEFYYLLIDVLDYLEK